MTSLGARAFYEHFQGMGSAGVPGLRSEEPAFRRLVAAFELELERVLESGPSHGAFQSLSAGWTGINLATSEPSVVEPLPHWAPGPPPRASWCHRGQEAVTHGHRRLEGRSRS